MRNVKFVEMKSSDLKVGFLVEISFLDWWKLKSLSQLLTDLCSEGTHDDSEWRITYLFILLYILDIQTTTNYKKGAAIKH